MHSKPHEENLLCLTWQVAMMIDEESEDVFKLPEL